MEYFLGGITLFAGTFAPDGWAFCDGKLLPIGQNTALFSLLGTTYGGDGTTNFALPNLADVGGAKYIIALQGIYPSRG
jgi:microcystin-dependent protein